MPPPDLQPLGDWGEWRTYILCGGPSVRGADLGFLRDCPVIAVNDAFRARPEARVFFSLDCTYFTDQRVVDELDAWPGVKVIALPRERWELRGLDRLRNALRLERVHAPGISEKLGTIHAGNSGFGALNLAVQLGARDVVLLGCDLQPTRDTHAFRPPNHRYTRRECARHVAQFESAASQLERLGVRVTVANLDSAVRCFPLVRIEDLA